MAKQQAARRVRVDVEPKWESTMPPTHLNVIEALNWYNVERTDKDAAKYLDTTPSIARDFLTLAWVTRMKSRGFIISKHSDGSLADMQMRFKQRTAGTDQAIDAPTNVISIQDRVRAKTDEILGEMEGLIDQYGIRGSYKNLNAYQWMLDNNVKPVHAARIIDHFRERSKEAMLAASGDKLTIEYYEGYSKSSLLNLLYTYAAIIKDAEKLQSNASLMRKPRKKKPVSFDKMVSKIKYLKKDDKLKIQSIDPIKIIGATQLWIFNAKTRKLGVYNATDHGGFKMKGTTILNYQEDASISKTLRKPEKSLPLVVDGGKIALRKVMDSINSKASKLNGRINKDTLLIRVI